MMNYIENHKFRLGALNTGAELRSFVDKRGGQEHEYLWQGGEPWNGCSPLLFPYVGRLKNGSYWLKGQEYSLAKHGFASKMEFKLVEKDDQKMTFLLNENEDTCQSYPFPFELWVTFALDEDGFHMEHRVKNTGSEKMYFCIGAHPGFQCEMYDHIVMDREEVLGAFQLEEHGLRSKERFPVFENSRELTITPTIFEKDALFFTELNSGGATLVRRCGRNVHVDFGGAPCLGIWAKPGASYVCIEPWFGIDDTNEANKDLTQKEYIQDLLPGKEFVFTVTVTVTGGNNG